MAVVASPTPIASSSKVHSHPPYKEMIVSAIESLKELKGSSKTAIAKYIESNYHDLPPTHNALLSHHLVLLKEEGDLQMVGKSYKLANSGEALLDVSKKGGPAFGSLNLLNPMGVPKKRGRPPKKLTSSRDHNSGIEKKKPGRPRKIPVQEGVGPPSENRKPGRPRKNASTVKLILPGHMKAIVVDKRKLGRQRKGTTPVNPESIIAMPMGEKRRPGRPKKGSLPIKQNLAVALALGGEKKRGRPKKLGTALALVEKRSPGRPKKLAAALALGEKRKPGRPKKLATALASIETALGEKRKPGRPEKLATALALIEKSKPGRSKNLAVALASGEKRKSGRPKKPVVASALGEKRKRGRPPTNSSSLFKPKFATMLALAEKRKPGRPKKGSSIPKLAAISTSGEKRKQGRLSKNSYLSPPLASGNKRKPGRPKKGSVTPKLDSALQSGEKRKRGRPKKVSAAMVNGGENVVMLPLVQNTAAEVSASVDSGSDNLPAMLVALSRERLVLNTQGEVSAAVEDGAVNLMTETLFLPEETAGEVASEALPIAVTPQDVAIPSEKRKRGRPKKESKHPVSAAIQNDGIRFPTPGDFGNH